VHKNLQNFLEVYHKNFFRCGTAIPVRGAEPGCIWSRGARCGTDKPVRVLSTAKNYLRVFLCCIYTIYYYHNWTKNCTACTVIWLMLFIAISWDYFIFVPYFQSWMSTETNIIMYYYYYYYYSFCCFQFLFRYVYELFVRMNQLICNYTSARSIKSAIC